MINRITYLITAFLFFIPFEGDAQKTLKAFGLTEVQVTKGPFYEAQMTDLDYIMEMDPDRLLAPFLMDAGLTPKAERYGNWENTGLDGHVGGHYLTALAQMYAATGNEKVLDRLNYMVKELASCQEKNGNGYVGGVPGGQPMWEEISKGNIDAGNFSLNDKWVPLYNIHKIYAGLRDAYLIAGNEQAKDILIGLTDWLVDLTADLSDAQIQEMLRSEHGGMNEVLADVYEITGDQKYLTLARKFSDRRILDPLLADEDQLTGQHANTQIPKVIGYERIGELAEDTSWVEAARFFWNTVVDNRTVSIGGNSVREHFNPINDFSSMIESNQGPETCNTYNMLRLSKMLFLSSSDPKYIDYYERGMYNHILSSQHPDGGFVYFTPMRPRHFRVYSQPHESFWCCVGSGIENHGKYAELIYARDENDLWVNLYIPSKLNWANKGVTVVQKTDFPFSESSTITLHLEKPSKFGLNLRVPKWIGEDKMTVRVNGKTQEVFAEAGSYLTINRKWKNNDVVSVTLPMHTEAEYLPDGSPWVSFVHGPIVLGAVTDSTDLGGIWADGSRMGHVANDRFYPLDEAPMLVVNESENLVDAIDQSSQSPLTFSTSGLIFPEKYSDLKLVPFFKIHNARYMIYWPVIQKGDLAERIETLREKEEKKIALEERTVDQVAPGEQQPESEHNYKGEETRSGLYQGRFWRAAQGWFSYELANPNKAGNILRITYFSADRDREFDIYLDDKLLASVTGDDTKAEGFYDVDYTIPDDMLGANMTVKFVAKERDSFTRGIYYVRLLKPEDE